MPVSSTAKASTSGALLSVPIDASQIPDDVRFDIPRRNQGQIVLVAYGGYSRGEHDEGDPYMRVVDQSEGQEAAYYVLRDFTGDIARVRALLPSWIRVIAKVENAQGVENIDELSIEGVVYDPARGSVVIVNGAILKEGEELGNVKVLEIKPEGAKFLVNGTTGFIPIYQDDSANRKNAKK